MSKALYLIGRIGFFLGSIALGGLLWVIVVEGAPYPKEEILKRIIYLFASYHVGKSKSLMGIVHSVFGDSPNKPYLYKMLSGLFATVGCTILVVSLYTGIWPIHFGIVFCLFAVSAYLFFKEKESR